MRIAKTLVNRIGELSGPPEKRGRDIVDVFHVYTKPFSKEKVVRWFKELPVGLRWVDEYRFKLDAHSLIFSPQTIGDFISLCESVNYTLDLNISRTDDLDRNTKSMLKQML